MAFVVATLVLPFLFRDRLPADIATHWGAGLRPDGSMSLRGLFVLQLVIVGGTWGALAGYGRKSMPPSPSIATAYFLFGLFLTTQVTIVDSNLDVTDWRNADALAGATLPTVLLMSAVMGFVGFLLGGGRANLERPPHDESAGP